MGNRLGHCAKTRDVEFYVSFLPDGSDQSRIDATVRTPLASIRFDEEQNYVEFSGNAAAMVKFVKEELQK